MFFISVVYVNCGWRVSVWREQWAYVPTSRESRHCAEVRSAAWKLRQRSFTPTEDRRLRQMFDSTTLYTGKGKVSGLRRKLQHTLKV